MTSVAETIWDIFCDHYLPTAKKIRIKDPRAIPMILLQGSIGAGDAYAKGYWDLNWDGVESDLADFFVEVAKTAGIASSDTVLSWAYRAVENYKHWKRLDPTAARSNIRSHYDNAAVNYLTRVAMGEIPAYTSAIADPDDYEFVASCSIEKVHEALAEIQCDKHNHIIETTRSELRSDEGSWLDVGCGWSALLEEAYEAGFSTAGVTLSEEQIAFAKEHDLSSSYALHNFLADDVEPILDLNHQASFDVVSAIEMTCHLGRKNLRQFYKNAKAVTHNESVLTVQDILCHPKDIESFKNVDYIYARTFPGSDILSVTEHVAAASAEGWKLVNWEEYPEASYPTTLRAWQRILKHEKANGFPAHVSDEDYRAYMYYLAYCEAGYRIGRLTVGTMVFRPL